MKLIILVALQCALLCCAADRPAPHRAAIAPSSAGDSDATSTHSQHVPRSFDDDLRLFNDFIREYKKTYQGEEKQRRFQIFQQTLDKIDRANANSKHAVYGITRFADMTREDVAQFTGYKYKMSDPTHNCVVQHSKDVPNVKVPESLDFRTKGIVTAVKDQGGCGACWAFSTTGTLEGLYAMKHKKLVSLSEQQMLDCGHILCSNGWWLDNAMTLLKNMSGIMSEVDYPYTSYNGSNSDCKFNDSAVVAKVKGCEMWKLNKNEELLKKVLFERGPLAISVGADSLLMYKNGVIEGTSCGAVEVDHAVLLVGYGIDNGVPYWLVKNSWSKDWGEDGYFRMQLGVNCLWLMDETKAEIVNGVIE